MELALALAALVIAAASPIATAIILGRRARELEISLGELAAATREPSLIGRTVSVNTRKPDDQTLWGVVDAQYDDGGLLLRGAIYVEPGNMLDAGDVHIAGDAISWKQLDAPNPVPAPAER